MCVCGETERVMQPLFSFKWTDKQWIYYKLNVWLRVLAFYLQSDVRFVWATWDLVSYSAELCGWLLNISLTLTGWLFYHIDQISFRLANKQSPARWDEFRRECRWNAFQLKLLSIHYRFVNENIFSSFPTTTCFFLIVSVSKKITSLSAPCFPHKKPLRER